MMDFSYVVDQYPWAEATGVGLGWHKFLEDEEVADFMFLVFGVVDDLSMVVSIFPLNYTATFEKTLNKTQLVNIDTPTKFWRMVGKETFKGNEFSLHGCNGSGTAMSHVVKTAWQVTCWLKEGWSQFCKLNKYKVGDHLLFSRINPFELQVDL